jgi:BlaI family transcriptional regulator, penicillinase repressor
MKKEKAKVLTKAEEQIMQVLWSIKKAFVKDIVEKLPDPKPAYTTVSTILKILENKGFIDHKTYGNTYEYFPLVSKDVYKNEFMGNFIKNYFSDSFQQMVSFFTDKNKVSLQELGEIKQMMEDEINKQKKIT